MAALKAFVLSLALLFSIAAALPNGLPANISYPTAVGDIEARSLRRSDDGTCPNYRDEPMDGCAAFCQVRTVYYYIQESPFARSSCQYPLNCEISESYTTSTGWSTSVSAKMGKAYKVGISGGYSYSQGQARGRNYKIELTSGQCGYFTFVGIMKGTCETYTEGLYIRDGLPEGVVLFVFTDCITRAPLDPEYQDPVYNSPGVALPRQASIDAQQTWVINTCNATPQGDLLGLGPTGYSFIIQGRGFSDDQIGPNGELLHWQLNGCNGVQGEVDNSVFNWTPDDPTYGWSASGSLSGEVKACIGDFVMHVGGATRDQCV
ncbi:Uu.00g052290.m01.CDS01 [Anthostomella pinea]|uniref:Uu.00g052290.m01.CDS01 n=1 Tax=Anthostomella pinea TaxID=933095 RepID=A0AAI8YPB0_9PEZI|nr:Uu.00g052290.m01.CDS01 [Anthostomella pinea]